MASAAVLRSSAGLERQANTPACDEIRAFLSSGRASEAGRTPPTGVGCRQMPSREDAFGLRLAAKASDRAKAAEQERPAFEERLKQLGYAPGAIAHAFSCLSGPGTVADTLEALNDQRRQRESHLIALSFEVTETRGGSSPANSFTITSVERDDCGVCVSYDIVPPLGFGSQNPRGEAKDDLGNDYHDLGGHFGLLAADEESTDITDGADACARGVLRMPLPPPAATTLRIRIMWDASRSSIWEGPAHEVRVSLAD
jgi:hypothetical protein